MLFNVEGVAAELCNCGTEEQFDNDVNVLIGANRNETVNHILYQKKKSFVSWQKRREK